MRRAAKYKFSTREKWWPSIRAVLSAIKDLLIACIAVFPNFRLRPKVIRDGIHMKLNHYSVVKEWFHHKSPRLKTLRSLLTAFGLLFMTAYTGPATPMSRIFTLAAHCWAKKSSLKIN